MNRLRSFTSACAVCACLSANALAQSPAEAPAELVPPALVQPVTPDYPESKRASGESAAVGLLLTLDTSGHVEDVEVTESAGAEFDEAAKAAARRLVFRPASRNGAPIAARIPFRFDFQVAAEEPAPPPPVAPPAPPAVEPPAPKAEPAPDESLDIDVEGEAPPREPTKRAMDGEEIRKIPGTNGDALRAVGNMPGVARAPGLDGALLVRGSAPNDTQVFIDGSSVPLAYHFGGVSSVIPSEMLERIDFYPGNFGPQYGRAMGGVIDVGVRSPRKDRLGGLVQVDLLDARFLVEAPLGESTRFMAGARRSWVDAWLGSMLEAGGVGAAVAPVYYDYQALVEHDLGDTTLRLFAYGSDDRLKLLFESPSAADPAEGGDVELHSSFYRVQASADSKLGDGARWKSMVSAGRNAEQFGLGSLSVDTASNVVDARSDLRAKLGSDVAVAAGLDVQFAAYDAFWKLPPMDVEGGPSGPLFGRPHVELRSKATVFRPGAYAMLEASPLPDLKVLPGIRTDYQDDTGRWTVDPRLGVRYDLQPGANRTTLKGGVGLYHQPPEPYESVEPFGTRGVRSSRATHYSLGIEQEFSRHVELSVEAFYKHLDDLVVAVDAADSSGNGIDYENIGDGRAVGAEFMLRYKPGARFFGWLAYTVSRSERRDGPGEAFHRFDHDQTHILTALGSLKLGRGWQLGGRFRYVTGNPYTPNVGGVMDHDAGAYAPVEARAGASRRLPAFHQLDVRVDKTWTFEAWKLTAYLDLQNAYNRKNPENMAYNYDYSKSETVSGLPILPVIGLRGEL